LEPDGSAQTSASTRHWRDEQGVWWDAEVSGQGRVPLPCPETTLTLDEIYAGIDP
jgi:hypothetical protein